MAIIGAWHSVERDVYHNNTECEVGNNIEPENCRSGCGDRRLCERCEVLNDQKESTVSSILKKLKVTKE